MKPRIYDRSRIRNFCVIAHIDHGKSTLADRLLLRTGTISQREARAQFLDSNSIERERGITIKAKAVRMTLQRGEETWTLNLIDTPGHVDFSYEVSRSLAACEGAVLLVDATQGVQAQTAANAYKAVDAGLEILPVVNKIDLPSAQTDQAAEEISHLIGGKPEAVLRVSAKEGKGVDELIEKILSDFPAPDGDPDGALQALIFDSVFDSYRGVVLYLRIRNGVIRRGDPIRLLGAGTTHIVEDVGFFEPDMHPTAELRAGEVGYLVANIREMRAVRVGDTVAHRDAPGVEPLPGYRPPVPVVFCGFFPTNDSDYESLTKALAKLNLNDAAFLYQADTSEALGFGYRCGFLGLLHMEIVQERLVRELGVEVVQTAPTVTYEIVVRGEGGENKAVRISNPADLPDESTIVEWREPIARVNIIVPSEFVGAITRLCEDRRGRYVHTEYLSPQRVILTYDMPFAEIVFDFYDKLKSSTRGYGTLDYELTRYQAADLVKLRILVAGQEVDALSSIIHADTARTRGRRTIEVLRKEIPRHLFSIALQASVGKRIVAREDISPMAKNVIAKCYGGDITRKRKLLERQKEGKKKMKNIGSVEIPQKAFTAVLSINRE